MKSPPFLVHSNEARGPRLLLYCPSSLQSTTKKFFTKFHKNIEKNEKIK
jgi:hypothetical protein